MASGSNEQPQKTGIGRLQPSTNRENLAAKRGEDMQNYLSRLIALQKQEDRVLREKTQDKHVPAEITTPYHMQLFLKDILPHTLEYQKFMGEWEAIKAVTDPPSHKEYMKRFRGALFQIICQEVLRHRYKDNSDFTVLSSDKTFAFMRELYPGVGVESQYFTVLDSLVGISVPDALVANTRDIITKGPLVLQEMQATIDTNPNHFNNEVVGLQGRLNQIKVDGALRLAYRPDTTILAMMPKGPAYDKSIDSAKESLRQRKVRVEIEKFPSFPLTFIDFKSFAFEKANINMDDDF